MITKKISLSVQSHSAKTESKNVKTGNPYSEVSQRIEASSKRVEGLGLLPGSLVHSSVIVTVESVSFLVNG